MTTTTIPGRHRSWRIEPRMGTGPDDRYTLLAEPVPGDDNPAAAIEDGQFPSWQAALGAQHDAERVDDGTHQPAPIPRVADMAPGSAFVARNTGSYTWGHWFVTYDGVVSVEGLSEDPVESTIRDYYAAPDLPASEAS